MKKERVSRTVRHTSVAILPSSNAWCTISASEVPASVDREKIRRKQCSTFQLPKNLSADIDKVLSPCTSLRLGNDARTARCWICQLYSEKLPQPDATPEKQYQYCPLISLSLKPDRAWGVQVVSRDGTWCFNGTKCTLVERLRADPSTGLCAVQFSCLLCSLPKPRCFLHTHSSRKLSQDRQEQKATSVLSPRGDF